MTREENVTTRGRVSIREENVEKNVTELLLRGQIPALPTIVGADLPDDYDPHVGATMLLEGLLGNGGLAQQKIAEVGLQLVCMLLMKNKRYGNSALEPVSVFAKEISRRQRLGVRMDDKITRLMRGGDFGDSENPRWDLAGYLILDLIAEAEEAE